MKKLLGVMLTGLSLSLFAFGCGESGEPGAPPPPGESPEELEKEMLESGGMEEMEGAGEEAGQEAGDEALEGAEATE